MSLLPDFLIIGAPKCGTTSLFHYLGDHPQIYIPSEKEPHFYSYVGEEQPHWGMEDRETYTSLFRDVQADQICGEASTWYLYSQTAAREIRKRAPDTRCIALLRQPVDRAYSSWSFRVQQGWEDLDFADAIAREDERVDDGALWDIHYLRAGLYYEQVRRFHEHLGSEQVKIFWFDDFTSNTDAVVEEALSFLGLDPADSLDTETIHNLTTLPRSQALNRLLNADRLRNLARQVLPSPIRSFLRRSVRQVIHRERPSLDPALRRKLTERVRPDIEQLEELLNVDLSRWTA
jgi:hypothetical protein